MEQATDSVVPSPGPRVVLASVIPGPSSATTQPLPTNATAASQPSIANPTVAIPSTQPSTTNHTATTSSTTLAATASAPGAGTSPGNGNTVAGKCLSWLYLVWGRTAYWKKKKKALMANLQFCSCKAIQMLPKLLYQHMWHLGRLCLLSAPAGCAVHVFCMHVHQARLGTRMHAHAELVRSCQARARIDGAKAALGIRPGGRG